MRHLINFVIWEVVMIFCYYPWVHVICLWCLLWPPFHIGSVSCSLKGGFISLHKITPIHVSYMLQTTVFCETDPFSSSVKCTYYDDGSPITQLPPLHHNAYCPSIDFFRRLEIVVILSVLHAMLCNDCRRCEPFLQQNTLRNLCLTHGIFVA